MNDYQSLIRLHRWQLDEKRRQHGELVKLHETLLALIEELDEVVRNERQVAGAADEPVFGYGAFVERTIAQRENIESSIAEVEVNLAVSLEVVSEAFREVKKFELAAEHAIERRRLWRARREQITLDELSIEMHRRQASA
jgi:flagellar export protein FliJ